MNIKQTKIYDNSLLLGPFFGSKVKAITLLFGGWRRTWNEKYPIVVVSPSTNHLYLLKVFRWKWKFSFTQFVARMDFNGTITGISFTGKWEMITKFLLINANEMLNRAITDITSKFVIIIIILSENASSVAVYKSKCIMCMTVNDKFMKYHITLLNNELALVSYKSADNE